MLKEQEQHFTRGPKPYSTCNKYILHIFYFVWKNIINCENLICLTLRGNIDDAINITHYLNWVGT